MGLVSPQRFYYSVKQFFNQIKYIVHLRMMFSISFFIAKRFNLYNRARMHGHQRRIVVTVDLQWSAIEKESFLYEVDRCSIEIDWRLQAA